MDKIEKIKELTKELLQYCHSYYDLDSPEISDAEYDKKYDELLKLENEANFWLANSPTRKVQGEVLPFLTKVHHSVPMLSADKSTNIEDVKKFIGNKDVVVSFKLDGSTLVVKYNDGKFIQALSRGSGTDGEDITHTARMIKNLPMTIPYKGYLEVRGEALIPYKYYNEMNADGSLGHPRNVASGGLRQLDSNEAAKRNIYFYAFTLVNWHDANINSKFESLNFLYNNGFDVVPHIKLPEFGDGTIETAIKYLDRRSYENPTDGWCFEYDDLAYGESLGSTGHHDRRLFALKPEVEEYETTLRDIEWTSGKTGQLTPTAIFDPVEIDNTIITKASVHNVSVIKKLGLKIGRKCIIYKANMIIPQILKCEGGHSAIEIPKYCPICKGNTKVVKENESEVLMCTNPNCTGKKIALFEHFVNKKAMNIEGMSEATIEFLINKGWIHTFKDIYHLSNYKEEWQRCNGFGKKSVENILNAIEKSRNVKMENYLCALGIPNVGLSTAKILSNKFNGDYDKFVQAVLTGFDLTSLEGFGDTIKNSILTWLRSSGLDDSLADEMKFIVEEKKQKDGVNLDGKTFCITGNLNHFANRDALIADIEAHNGKFVSAISTKCNYLINNDSTSSSSKNKKAQALNIPIITEEEYLQIIKEEEIWS